MAERTRNIIRPKNRIHPQSNPESIEIQPIQVEVNYIGLYMSIDKLSLTQRDMKIGFEIKFESCPMMTFYYRIVYSY